MQTVRTFLLAGATAVLLSATCGAAVARSPEIHTMTVRLPGGGVEEIRYTGDVAPQVVVTPHDAAADIGWPVAFFGPDSVFADMARISAEMNRQMDLVLRNARSLAEEPGTLTEINAGKLPAGAQSYSFVSTVSGNGVCAKSVEITARGDGQKPQVVSKSWGDCGKAHAGAGVNSPAPASSEPSDVREIRYDSRTPAPIVREAGLF